MLESATEACCSILREFIDKFVEIGNVELVLDERSGRIQGLKAASTTKSKNDFKIYG
jgi:hypothetical protein